MFHPCTLFFVEKGKILYILMRKITYQVLKLVDAAFMILTIVALNSVKVAALLSYKGFKENLEKCKLLEFHPHISSLCLNI